mgnify:CR=1 FL=1
MFDVEAGDGETAIEGACVIVEAFHLERAAKDAVGDVEGAQQFARIGGRDAEHAVAATGDTGGKLSLFTGFCADITADAAAACAIEGAFYPRKRIIGPEGKTAQIEREIDIREIGEQAVFLRCVGSGEGHAIIEAVALDGDGKAIAFGGVRQGECAFGALQAIERQRRERLRF